MGKTWRGSARGRAVREKGEIDAQQLIAPAATATAVGVFGLGLGFADFQVRPSTSLPLRMEMAFWASALVAISIKPNPRG